MRCRRIGDQVLHVENEDRIPAAHNRELSHSRIAPTPPPWATAPPPASGDSESEPDETGLAGPSRHRGSTESTAPPEKPLHSIYDRVQRNAGPHRSGALVVVREVVAPDV